jgi:hypothetical protein
MALPELVPLSPAEEAAIARKRRGRNLAMLVVLLLLCALFYALAWVKLSKA